MKNTLLASLLLLVTTCQALAEFRFEVLSFESLGNGNLLSIVDRADRPLTPQQMRVHEELRRFYAEGRLEYARDYRSGRLREVARNTGLLVVLHAERN